MSIFSWFAVALCLFATQLAWGAFGTAEIVDGRLKVQMRLHKDQSLGAFELRSILEKIGFKTTKVK